MIKVTRHRLTCRCDDCVEMFPPDRYEAAWTLPAPEVLRDGAEPPRRVVGRVPLGAANATWPFVVWVDADDRLVTDWPGFPGTHGAKVEIDWRAPEGPEIVGTRDPALAALAEPVPLRRIAVERLNARCMVDFGLAGDDTADYIACPEHGRGLPALACRCVVASESPLDAVVLYGVDGDYPDLLCTACLPRYLAQDLEVVVTVCSVCQQRHLYRHRLVARTWYGAPPQQ